MGDSNASLPVCLGMVVDKGSKLAACPSHISKAMTMRKELKGPLSTSERLRIAWWVQIGLALLAGPWMMSLASRVLESSDSAGTHVGDGLIEIFVFLILNSVAWVYVACFVAVALVGLFAPWDSRGLQVFTLVVIAPWLIVFLFISLFESRLMVVFTALLIGLAVTSIAQMSAITNAESRRPPPPQNPPVWMRSPQPRALPPPPPVPPPPGPSTGR